MKTQLLLVLLLVVAINAKVRNWPGAPENVDDSDPAKVIAAWGDYKREFGKAYEPGEEREKFQNFKANIRYVRNLNRKNPKAHFALNKFADLSAAEFRERYLLKEYKRTEVNKKKLLDIPPLQSELPKSFDWRDHGAVTPVKDQGQCGSCWAFSTVEAIESQWFLAGHPLPVLSEQQIVDCDQGRGDYGCGGGDTVTAYAYVIAAGGLNSESAYPYTAEDGNCRFKRSDVVASIKDWGYVTKNHNETQMQVALVSKGPLSICVDASSWQFYEGGVITSFCSNSLDHCVMITGYGDKEGWDGYTYSVWIVRNSWGSDWGYNGYLYVERGYDLCGISDEVTLPVV